MFGKDENIRDTAQNPLKDSLSTNVHYNANIRLFDAYPKVNKLITALYMVTDIIDKREPIRLELRTLGLEILSDKNSLSRTELKNKVHSILSFLDICVAVNLISEMNFSILKKEFTAMNYLIEKTDELKEVKHTWLEEFLFEPTPLPNPLPKHTNIVNFNNQATYSPGSLSLNKTTENTAIIVKKERREDIIKAIESNGGNATITEVRSKGMGTLTTCSEKTLQRELMSMVKDGVLTKTGEKRWSKYFLKDIN